MLDIKSNTAQPPIAPVPIGGVARGGAEGGGGGKPAIPIAPIPIGGAARGVVRVRATALPIHY